MIVNPEKFQSMILQKTLLIDEKSKVITNSIKLIGRNIGNKLTFENHKSGLSNKVAMQLNAKGR